MSGHDVLDFHRKPYIYIINISINYNRPQTEAKQPEKQIEKPCVIKNDQSETAYYENF